MARYLFILISLISLSSFAEELIVCKTAASCKCPDKDDLAYPSEFKFDERAVVSCRPILKDIMGALNQASNTSLLCPDPNPNTLYDQVISTFPQGCGYVWKQFDRANFLETIRTFLKDDKVLCDKDDHHAMCTSATFLAFLKAAKKLKEKGVVSDEQLALWSDLDDGPAWKLINNQARPDLLVEQLNLGVGKTLRKNELPSDEWPKEGDLLQFWREDSSGHSTVFAGYLKNSVGETEAICYWSANAITHGYGKRCEPLKVVNRMIIGRFNP